MALLLGILYFLRRRHPREAVDLWIVGLLFIFLEAIVHAAYPSAGPWERVAAHVVSIKFVLRGRGHFSLGLRQRSVLARGRSLRYLVINSLPAVALLTTYGLGFTGDPAIYYFVSGAGLLSRSCQHLCHCGYVEARPRLVADTFCPSLHLGTHLALRIVWLVSRRSLFILFLSSISRLRWFFR